MLDYVVSKIHEQGPREEQQDTLGMVKIGQSIRFIVIDGMGGTQSGKRLQSWFLLDLESTDHWS